MRLLEIHLLKARLADKLFDQFSNRYMQFTQRSHTGVDTSRRGPCARAASAVRATTSWIPNRRTLSFGAFEIVSSRAQHRVQQTRWAAHKSSPQHIQIRLRVECAELILSVLGLDGHANLRMYVSMETLFMHSHADVPISQSSYLRVSPRAMRESLFLAMRTISIISEGETACSILTCCGYKSDKCT